MTMGESVLYRSWLIIKLRANSTGATLCPLMMSLQRGQKNSNLYVTRRFFPCRNQGLHKADNRRDFTGKNVNLTYLKKRWDLLLRKSNCGQSISENGKRGVLPEISLHEIPLHGLGIAPQVGTRSPVVLWEVILAFIFVFSICHSPIPSSSHFITSRSNSSLCAPAVQDLLHSADFSSAF